MDELEKAKLLSVATKLAKAEVEEVRSQLIEQINSIQIPDVKDGRDGRSISDARIFDGQLVLQLSDGALVTVGSVIGEQGPVGPIGTKGDKGDKGDTGEQGVPGPRGDTGEQGLAGKDGVRGPQGEHGLKGDKGDQGERGEQGEQGVAGQRGQRGERGTQGPSGTDGTNGRDGNDGAKGETGERGPQGVPGRDGKEGPVGQQGPKGNKGDKGDKGDPGSDADVTKLEKKFDQLTEQVDKRISKVAFNVAAAGAGVSHSGSGEVLLHRLDDVDYNTVKSPTDGQVLTWSSSLGKWQANTASGGASYRLVNGSYNVTLQANSALRLPSGVKLLSGYPGQGYIDNFGTLAGDYVYLSSANGYAYVGVENQLPSIGTGSSVWFFRANGSIQFPDNTFQSTAYRGLTVSKILTNNTYSNVVSNITGIRFDDDSGFDVTNLGGGNVKIAMNSTFKYWKVNGAAGLTAVGLDTANFIAGSGITISANSGNNSLTFTATGGSSNDFMTTVRSQSIFPAANATYNLGTPSKRYKSLYLFDGVNVTGSAQSDIANLTVTSLILRNVLGPQYGGTGLSSFIKDGILFGSTTSRLGFITGSSGDIMQISANGTPSFGALDGGSYA